MEHFENIEELKAAMLKAGAIRLYQKSLAPNDNFKNQIYLGGSFSVLNQLPAKRPEVQENGKTLWAQVDFLWLENDNEKLHAPHTKLILYPQYPEVRLSGFLAGCNSRRGHYFDPAKLGRTVGRVMFLGVTAKGQIIGHVTAAGTQLSGQTFEKVTPEGESLLRRIPLHDRLDDRQQLLSELTRIHQQGWIESKSLRADGTFQPCASSNCVGLTLEAELGVAKNGRPEPDFLGWEIKASLVSRLDRPPTAKPQTLFTPEPTFGFYKSDGVEAFVRKYGYIDRMGREDRLNFGGKFVYGIKASLTNLTLSMDGYNPTKGTIENSGGGIVLYDQFGDVAAGWTFSGLLERWSRKHDRAAYISGMKDPDQWRFRYGNDIRLALGTDFSLFLKAVYNGLVYYDPGIKIEEASTLRPKIKRRSQFRIASNRLSDLYHQIENVKLEEG
jgi:hypothetical protein